MSQQVNQVAMSIYEYQPPAVLNQGAPVQNDWYDLLPVTKNCRVKQIHVNIEDNDETLEVRMTIDGEVLIGSNACTHSTNYPVGVHADAELMTDVLEFDTVPAHFGKYRAFLKEGKSIQIEVRKTTAAGVGNLTGIVTYGIKKPA